MKIIIIANPVAGGKSCGRRLAKVSADLSARGIDHQILLSRHHGHAIDLAADLEIDAWDAIVAMGGDGANFQVLNGLLKSRPNETLPPLGLIPAGRGNSFAKDLHLRSINDAIDAIENGKSQPVDVCRFSQNQVSHYFVNMAGVGFVADVAATARAFRALGAFSYVAGVFIQAIKLQFYQMQLEIDGRQWAGPNCFVEFCNSRFTGGHMCMAPHARIDDGLMDVVIAGPMTRRSLLATFPKIFSGAHGQNPAIEFVQTQKAVIHTTPVCNLLPDGELSGTTPTEIDILPAKIRYLMGSNTDGK